MQQQRAIAASRPRAAPAAAPRPQRARRVACAAGPLKLYTNPGSRGKIAEFYLAELGLDVETVQVDMRGGDHKKEAYRKLHPFGQVPVLDDGGLPIFESGAILIHLANKYGKLDPDALGRAASWILFANSTLCEALFGGASSKREGLLDTLESILSKQPYLEGDEFTVSDVAVGSYLLYMPLFFPDSVPLRQRAVWDYAQRVAARDACPQSYKDGVAAAVAKGGGGGGGVGGLFSKISGR
ncbi:glutathione S-transferase [Raphidocelis subcapitata]|uniref:Glutathione S-transferase n=1 Tax=Raphidocelis subcapitata TaxID=307507 RepID=A0A2V0PDZ5_9CHLO|nr:glutathione S-transferase [Raphidocelis subcapitata]|eukprot:GBF98066.1 glutathione S-transferase [Raphidocelis subcapitata]